MQNLSSLKPLRFFLVVLLLLLSTGCATFREDLVAQPPTWPLPTLGEKSISVIVKLDLPSSTYDNNIGSWGETSTIADASPGDVLLVGSNVYNTGAVNKAEITQSVRRIFENSIVRAFQDSGMFSKVVLGERSEQTDLKATVTLEAIDQESLWFLVSGLSLGLIPAVVQSGTFDLKLVYASGSGDIFSVASEHEESRTWGVSLFKPLIRSTAKPALANEIAYDLTRSALYKVSQKAIPSAPSSSQFY